MKLRHFLDNLVADSHGRLASKAYAGVSLGQIQKYGPSVQLYSGKVRDMVRSASRLYMVHSDRLSAFDRAIGLVPCKGLILCHISQFWMENASRLMPTHYIKAVNDRVLSLKPMQPVKIEVVVRGYLAGSMQRAYASGERSYCGQSLPDNLAPFGRLAKPMITPTTKAEVFQHDENISAEELMRSGVVTDKEWHEIEAMAFRLFSLGSEEYRKRGWILADTKYEFGKDQNGQLTLIDEIHTPDSSRLWEAKSYSDRLLAGNPPEMLDKENVRRYLISQGFSGEGKVPEVPDQQFIDLAMTYLQVAERLLGRELEVMGDPCVVD